MLKRGILTLFIFVLLIIGFSNVIFAQEDSPEEFSDAQLETSAGTTPDSFFYFLDKFFDGFGDELKVKEEKVAEIRAMIQSGNIDAARIALQRYYQYADSLEKEVSPEMAEEARRSAAAIRNALAELEAELSDEERDEFVNSVNEKEDAILTAAEIAGKIKDLCEILSQLDPLEYSRVCRTSDDAPEWHQDLDDRLTEGQRQEVKLFGDIMSECFETSGQQCRCEEIPFTEFAKTCSIAAPLAVQCNIEGDEEACEELDNLEMPELPPHLQDVFETLERDISEAQFDLHMPRECIEAGATTPRECMKIMVQTHAPEECRDAILEADVQNEREAREICEKIMFELNAPEECIERGLTNPKECGVLMFQLNAPQECLDAGLTGEHRSDQKKCEVIMREKGGPGGFGPPALGIRCREISNPEERLACYDAALGGAQGAYVESRGEPTQGWPEPCQEANALTRESCEQVMRQFAEQQKQEFEEFHEGESSASFNVDDQRQRCETEGGNFVCEGDNCFCRFGESSTTSETTTTTETQTQTTTTTEPSSTTTTTESTTTSEGTITGGVIFGDNNFLQYFYR